ncbi:MAG: ABC transporter ATP-binding protein, partial [Phycisphaerales bacterium]
MATLLTCQSISKAYGRGLFSGVSISLADGERVGMIGPNGSGKTTLLRILAGLEDPDDGEVNTRRNARIALLPQIDEFPPAATCAAVLAASLEGEHVEPHERDSQVAITLSRFGFDDADQPVEALSGGWRKRLALAREILRRPDLLLLDEPTNHLDLDGILWLEEMLLEAPFAFLAVSHDRYFLERVTTRVIELNPVYPDGCFSVSGSYSTFLDKRAEFLEAQQAQQETLANVVRRESAFLKANSKAQRKKSKVRIEDAYRLKDELRELEARNTLQAAAGIDFDGTGRRTRKLIEAKGLAKAMGGRPLFSDVSLLLSPGTRLGLVGANGSGKTTFIRVLTGSLLPDAGTIRAAEGLRVVVFDQRREELPPDEPLRRALARESDRVVFRGRPVHVTAWAKRFLFRVDQLDLPVRELSGGEQARILIARLVLQPADVLVLDEPTNDLDIASLDILEESLAEFPGAIVLVTHDRFMLDRLCTEVIGFDGLGHAHTCANCQQWLAHVASKARAGDAAPARRNGGATRGEAAVTSKSASAARSSGAAK